MKRVARNLFIKIRPSQEILKIRDVARILFFKIRPPQEILKIRDGTPMEAEEILIYIKKPSYKSVWHFSSNLDVPINVVQKKRVLQILFFTIRPSQEILKIYSNLDVPTNVVQSKRVAHILFFKIRPSQEILKIRDGTPMEAEEILIYIKSPQNKSVWHFSSNLDVPSNVVQKKRVARIMFFKIRPSQEILKIRDGTPMEAEEILIYIKSPQTNRPSQEILKIRDGTPLEAEEILIYIKSPQTNRPSQEILKILARNLFIKIRPSQEILKIRDGTSLETEEILTYIKKPSKQIDVPINVVQKKRVARILFFKIRPSQEILKIRHGTPLETEEILTYIKSPQNRSFWHFYSNLDVPSNVVQKKRVARILFFKIRPYQEILKIHDVARNMFIKIRPSQEILKIRDGTSLETEEILTYIKKPSKQIGLMPSQEILKIRHGTPLEMEEILTYIKSPQNRSFWHFYSNLDIPSNVVQRKEWRGFYVPSNVVHKKRVARNLFIKITPSQEILKIRDDNLDVPTNVVQSKRVAHILFFKIRPSQEILKIRDGTPMEAEEILIYIKSPQNKSVWHFSSNLDVPSNVVQKKRVARIMFFKIRPSQEILKIRDGTPMEAEEILIYIKSPQTNRPSQEILKIRDGTPLEAEEILIYIKSPQTNRFGTFLIHKKRVARNLFIKIRPSQEILKIRDGTSLETEEILTYIKKPSKQIEIGWHFSSNLDVPINVVQKKRVARILFFKIRPSQEILKIRHGTPLETEEILTYIKSPQNRSFWHFYSNLDVPSNVVQKKRVARILFFKIRPYQEILKIHDVARNMFIKIRPSQEILKIRDGTSLETEEILTYIKKPSKQIGLALFEQFRYVPINVVQKKRVARILFFKIRPSQEILKIRHGTPLEMEEILTYIKSPQNRSFWHFYSNLDVPSNVVQKKKVARILFFKIRPSQEILKIRDGTPMEAEEILIYIKKPS
ncbi:hypothetical protein OROMI_001888 [Orobanche minor]